MKAETLQIFRLSIILLIKGRERMSIIIILKAFLTKKQSSLTKVYSSSQSLITLKV